MCVVLTTQWWAPPFQDDSSLSALTGVGLQCVTKALVSIGPAGTEIIHTGSVPRFRGYHTMTGLKGSRFQDLTASVSPLLGLVACLFTGVDVLTGTTGCQRVATICDLKWQIVVWLVFVWQLYFFYYASVYSLSIYLTLQLLPKSDSDWLIRPFGIRRSSW